jgi:hypothetical protein
LIYLAVWSYAREAAYLIAHKTKYYSGYTSELGHINQSLTVQQMGRARKDAAKLARLEKKIQLADESGFKGDGGDPLLSDKEKTLFRKRIEKREEGEQKYKEVRAHLAGKVLWKKLQKAVVRSQDEIDAAQAKKRYDKATRQLRLEDDSDEEGEDQFQAIQKSEPEQPRYFGSFSSSNGIGHYSKFFGGSEENKTLFAASAFQEAGQRAQVKKETPS